MVEENDIFFAVAETTRRLEKISLQKTHLGTFFLFSTTYATMDKDDVLVMAFDIEMSGATIPPSAERHDTELFNPSGQIIAIGASVIELDAKNKAPNRLGSLFVPMFRPVKKKLASGEEVEGFYVHRENEPWLTLHDYEGNAFEGAKFPLKEARISTVFEGRCWDQIWSKQVPILKGFVEPYEHEDYFATYKFASDQLMFFRAEWEKKAEERGSKLVLCSDNVTFDISMLNHMLWETKPSKRPMNYKASANTKYAGSVKDTHSMQDGVLSVLDKEWILSKDKTQDLDWMEWLEERAAWTDRLRKAQNLPPIDPDERIKPSSYSKRLEYLYDLPPLIVAHDHNPTNDAVTIAWEYMVLWAACHDIFKLASRRKTQAAPKMEESTVSKDVDADAEMRESPTKKRKESS